MKLPYHPLQPPVLLKNRADADYRYREFAPGEQLRPYVACYWTVETRASSAPGEHRVIPDGCVDIIIDLNAPSPNAFAVGIMTGSETPLLEADRSYFGIRFFAERAHRFIRCPVSELGGRQVPLESLWGGEAVSFLDETRDSEGTVDRVEWIESRLVHALLRSQSDIRSESWSERLLQSGMRRMHASRGRLSVRELAVELGYSERSVRRLFMKELGVGPKKLLDIVRFQSVLQRLHQGPAIRLTDLAFAYGYSDQPHFTSDFKRFYGLPPKQAFQFD